MVMSRSGHGPKWLWAEMTSDPRFGIFLNRKPPKMAAACDTEGIFSDYSFMTIFEVSVGFFVISFQKYVCDK